MTLIVLSALFPVDLITANGVKSALVFTMNVTATVVFVSHQLVSWPEAIGLSIGMMTGAKLAVRLAVRKGERWVRVLLVGVTASAALWFLLGAPM